MHRRNWALGVAAAVGLLVGLGGMTGTVAQEKAKAARGQLTFEIYKDAKEGFRWRLKAANGQVIATSGQGYKAKADCDHAIEVIKEGAAKAKVQDATAN